MPMNFVVRPDDIRRIKITCRCGEKSVAEVPQQLARMINAHICPKCNAVFGMQIQADKTWKIKRVNDGDMPGVAISADQMERLHKLLQTQADEEEQKDDNKWKN
jgi:hypothetical protein